MILTPNLYDTFSIQYLEKQRLNDDEFFAFCQLNNQLKIEREPDGNIIVMALTGGITGKKNSELNADFTIWNRKSKSGVIFDSSTGFNLADGATRSPDLAWIRNEVWNSLTKAEQTKFPPVCPDFLVELMSETDTYKVAKLKMEEYIDNGCRLVWLINPKLEEVHIFRADGTIAKLIGFDQKISGEDVLEGFEFDLSLLR